MRRDRRRCAYCGDGATSIDHVPPLLVRPLLRAYQLQQRYPFQTVPACRECRLALASCEWWTLTERRAAVHQFLRRKYRHVLEIPAWTDSDLAHLSPPLRGFVIKALHQQALLRARLAWREPASSGEARTPRVRTTRNSAPRAAASTPTGLDGFGRKLGGS